MLLLVNTMNSDRSVLVHLGMVTTIAPAITVDGDINGTLVMFGAGEAILVKESFKQICEAISENIAIVEQPVVEE